MFFKDKQTMSDHLNSFHMGMVWSCDKCNKTWAYRNGFYKHTRATTKTPGCDGHAIRGYPPKGAAVTKSRKRQEQAVGFINFVEANEGTSGVGVGASSVGQFSAEPSRAVNSFGAGSSHGSSG